jgi:hypothetical protein
VAGAPTLPALTLCTVSLSVSEGADPLHNVQSRIFRSLMKIPTICFTISSPMSFRSSDVFASLSLDPLCRYCIPVATDAFSRTSVLPGFLVPHCPSLVLDDSVPYDTPLLRGGSSLCGRQPNFRDPLLPSIPSFGFSRRPTATFPSPCRFFSAPKVSTAAFS